MKHTPGPWEVRVSSASNAIYVLDHENAKYFPTSINKGILTEKAKANAKLIAAAPEMLDALQEIYHLLDEHEGEARWYLKSHYNKLNSAIKKATE